jgi:hypothetical protein
MHVGACVAINAKGGECWQILNKTTHACILVIDGKHNNEDGMSTESM